MNYLSVENLGKNHGERILFEGLTFGLNKGDKMALIANNGSGKTSILKIIAGQDISDEGTVILRKGIKVAYLAQEPDFDANHSLENLINENQTEISLLIKQYQNTLKQIEVNSNTLNNKALEDLTNKMDRANAWDYERRIKQILFRFNISDLTQKVGDLSGGQKKRLSLALLLLNEPDLLLLDEPTNHLDVEMIEWLEKYLQQQKFHYSWLLMIGTS